MTQPIQNENNSGSFFQSQFLAPDGTNLVNTQVDVSQPLMPGLDAITDPIQALLHSSERFPNFDPDLYDLRDSSHLSRLLKALTGASGTGGMRKQYAIARLSNVLGGAHFTDLDGFYGALFGVGRTTMEQIPNNSDGNPLNPMTDVASLDVWDDVESRDGRFRSRLVQLAKAINMGATYSGLRGIAEALLNCDVDIFESWVKVDLLLPNQLSAPIGGYTYLQIHDRYITYGGLDGLTYGSLSGGVFGSGQTPLGNRGEIVVVPKRPLNLDEQYQVTKVLQILKPTHCQITLEQQDVQIYTPIQARTVYADSENWTIVSQVTPQNNLVDPASSDIYPLNSSIDSSARPAFSEYSGESWTYNNNVVTTTSYQMQENVVTAPSDDQLVTFLDGSSHLFASGEAVMTPYQAVAARLASDGIMVSFPYSGPRPQYPQG